MQTHKSRAQWAPSGSCMGCLGPKARSGNNKSSWRKRVRSWWEMNFLPLTPEGSGEPFKDFWQENHMLLFVFLEEISVDSSLESGLEEN